MMAHEQILQGQNCNSDTYATNVLCSTTLEPFHYEINCQTAPTDSLPWPEYGDLYFTCPSGYQSPGTANPLSKAQFSTPLREEILPIPTSPTSARDSKTFPQRCDQNGKFLPAFPNTEKRRQQNRNSQIAFRERSRRNLKKLQEELTQSLSANEELYNIMEELLERTEDLKRSIENVLTSRLKRSHSTSFSSPQTSPS